MTIKLISIFYLGRLKHPHFNLIRYLGYANSQKSQSNRNISLFWASVYLSLGLTNSRISGENCWKTKLAFGQTLCEMYAIKTQRFAVVAVSVEENSYCLWRLN